MASAGMVGAIFKMMSLIAVSTEETSAVTLMVALMVVAAVAIWVMAKRW